MKDTSHFEGSFTLLGVMSGTSLDGIDFAIVRFSFTNRWEYKVLQTLNDPYPLHWQKRLQYADALQGESLHDLDSAYTKYLASRLNGFMQTQGSIPIDLISSHGHTVHHQPEKGYTYQIGNLPELATLTHKNVVCDFRTADVALGGQGAPLVPGGEVFLFDHFDACVNLGGFANITFLNAAQPLAYDLCAVNTVMNALMAEIELPYDHEGALARSGELIPSLYNQLNQLPFYPQSPPKSLGIEWVRKSLFPLLQGYNHHPLKDRLHTYVLHIAKQIGSVLPSRGKVLFTGGGVWNCFLMDCIQEHTAAKIQLPSEELIDYKEAIVFAFLGLLRWRNEINCLSAVTGAKNNHSSGKIFFP